MGQSDRQEEGVSHGKRSYTGYYKDWDCLDPNDECDRLLLPLLECCWCHPFSLFNISIKGQAVACFC